MAQHNMDAARGTNPSGAFAVTTTTGPLTLSGPAAISFDTAATKSDVLEALRAARRAVSRAFGEVDDPADLATSGSSRE